MEAVDPLQSSSSASHTTQMTKYLINHPHRVTQIYGELWRAVVNRSYTNVFISFSRSFEAIDTACVTTHSVHILIVWQCCVENFCHCEIVRRDLNE